MLSIVFVIKELDKRGIQMYTKAGKNSAYVESIYQGGSIMMKYDLSEYKDKLSSLNLVQENHIPYMVGWVKHFITLGKPSEAEFADTLSIEGREDWQIRQALDAVKIYRSMLPEKVNTEEEKADNPLGIMRDSLRVRHYAKSTEKSYMQWCSRYLVYCERNGVTANSDTAFRAYLSHLALERRVSSSTQNQAFNAVLFLFRNVWSREPDNIDAVRARKPSRLPVVLTQEEVRKVLEKTNGITGMVIRLIYSSGLRLSEALRLRVQDINFESRTITVRSGKGNKDRITILGSTLISDLQTLLEKSREMFENAVIQVSLPSALERKYPNAGLKWGWQYLFPSTDASINPATGEIRRHHIHRTGIQKAMRKAVKEAGITKHAGVHTLRHCFATHLLMSGVDICEIQELLGHKSLETTRVYLHVLKGLRSGVRSPLDLLGS